MLLSQAGPAWRTVGAEHLSPALEDDRVDSEAHEASHFPQDLAFLAFCRCRSNLALDL